MDALPANRSWQPSCSYGTYQHEAITSRSRQLLMMGTWLPETCWATSRREIKNTKVTSSWFFLSVLFASLRSLPCLTFLPSYNIFTSDTEPTNYGNQTWCIIIVNMISKWLDQCTHYSYRNYIVIVLDQGTYYNYRYYIYIKLQTVYL